MNEITLTLDSRSLVGKHASKLRREGLVPSVVYGGTSEPLSMQSGAVETAKVAHAAGKHTPVHLMIDGKNKLAIIKSIDRDPVRHTLRHVAFHTIKQNEMVSTEVPVVLIGMGESVAERAGFVVLQAIEDIAVKAIPVNLPESIELDITKLATPEDKITIADITLPHGVEFSDHEQDTSLVVANVYEPSRLQSANEALGGEAEEVSDVAAENGSAVSAEPETKK